jgi:hypothetical protein
MEFIPNLDILVMAESIGVSLISSDFRPPFVLRDFRFAGMSVSGTSGRNERVTSLHPISLWITGLKRAHTTIQKHTQNGLPNHPSYARSRPWRRDPYGG